MCVCVCVCVYIYIHLLVKWECPHGVRERITGHNLPNYHSCSTKVNAMDSGIIVREFKLQSHYYIHFQINTLGKGMNI